MQERLHLLLARTAPILNNGRAGVSLIMADETLKKEINAVYHYYFGKPVTGCVNCYADALAELNYIKNRNMERSNIFIVRRGKVLKDVIANDARMNLVRGNETDELALYHLYTNPNARQHFEKLPDGDRLEKMLAEYGEKFEAEHRAKRDKSFGNAAADMIVDAAKTEAAKIVEDAKVEAADLIEMAKMQATGEIVDAAKTEAAKIVEDAKVEAAEILKKAKNANKGTVKADPIME